MTNRILLAGLLGGLALFLWEFVAHELTPLGEAGISTLSNEAAVRSALKQAIPHGGLYYFPAPTDVSKEAMNKAMEEARNGPYGLMVFYPYGVPVMTPRQLVTQFVLDVAAMLLAAWLLAQLPSAGFAGRFLFVASLGLLPGLRSHIPLWNWYHFPRTYAAAGIGIDLGGFIIAGFILARVVQSRSKTMAAAS